MNKTDFISLMSELYNCNRKEASVALDMVLDTITHALAHHQEINLIGFGKLSKKYRPERTGRNPKSGARMLIKGYHQVLFSAGQKLKEAANAHPEVEN